MTSPNLLSVIEASKLLHNQGIFVYWAGTHVTLLPKISLQDSCVDAVLRGEAEQNLYEFYLWRQGKISADAVPGLCYIDNGEFRISPIPAITIPDTLGYHPLCFVGHEQVFGQTYTEEKELYTRQDSSIHDE